MRRSGGQSRYGIPCRELHRLNSQSETGQMWNSARVEEFRSRAVRHSEIQKFNSWRAVMQVRTALGSALAALLHSGNLCQTNSSASINRSLPHGEKTLKLFLYRSACSILYCFNLRWRVVLPIPSMRAAASLSPPVSRKVRRIARLSSSSSGNNSSFSGARSLLG
jgi:hypothetical protein